MIISLSMGKPRRRPNTTGSRTAPQPFVTDAQWAIIRDLFRIRRRPQKAVVLAWDLARVWKASSGCSRTAPDGKIYQSGIRLLQPATGDTASGPSPASGKKPGAGSCVEWIGESCCTGPKRWATGRFHPQKRGP